MNVKMVVEGFLKEKGFDGLFNPDVPCGCLNGDIAPCGEMSEKCQAGYKVDVDSSCECGCDGQGEAHWHITAQRQEGAQFSDWMKTADEWVCECGERCDPSSSAWRWNGNQWEHSHGYPVGHVVAEMKGPHQ